MTIPPLPNPGSRSPAAACAAGTPASTPSAARNVTIPARDVLIRHPPCDTAPAVSRCSLPPARAVPASGSAGSKSSPGGGRSRPRRPAVPGFPAQWKPALAIPQAPTCHPAHGNALSRTRLPGRRRSATPTGSRIMTNSPPPRNHVYPYNDYLLLPVPGRRCIGFLNVYRSRRPEWPRSVACQLSAHETDRRSD
jgi:hypothetical protein